VATLFYADTATEPPLLLRLIDNMGQVWDDGKWVPTRLLMDAFAGHNFYVESVSEAEARKLAPAAFA
jgi:hypothetical protein